MPRINQLPAASSVAQTDVLAIDTADKTYKVPRSVLAPAPYIATIPTGQWSGSGSDRYITVTASNVTANAMLYPFYDNASAALLNGPVWVIPAAGSFTIHTSAIPSGTVTISVLLAGIVGEAQYQVLADVYSKSQVDLKIQQSTAYVTEYVNIGAEDMLAKIAQMDADTMIYFRTTSTTTNGPKAGMYLIGTAIRTGNNINISATDMANPSVIYQNGTNTGGTTWSGWTRNGCLVFGNITTSEIYDILCQIPIGQSVPFITTNANTTSTLTGGKVSALLKGVVGRTGANGQYFDFFCAQGSTQYIYTWQVTAMSASSITPGTVYRYTGTAI